MKKLVYIICALCMIAHLTACEDTLDMVVVEETNDASSSGEYADLTISLRAPQLDIKTRALDNIALYPTDNTKWTDWEKFVDGALLYRVTLFVINNSSKQLVAYRDFYYDSETIKGDIYADTDPKGGNGFCTEVTETTNSDGSITKTGTVVTNTSTGIAVKATFKNANPVHGEIERLAAGNYYTIMAVANFSPKDSYTGLGMVEEDGTGNSNGDIISRTVEEESSNIGFHGLVNEIISDFKGTAVEGVYPYDGLTNQFNIKNYGEFFTYKLNSGSDKVCGQWPQPLVMIRNNVQLQAGKNQISGELSRTFARIRLNVENKSSNAYLDISNLVFADAFASQKAYLFNDKSTNAGTIGVEYGDFKLYAETAGVIGVTSSDAIVPAAATNSNQQLLPLQNAPIFDCYILEGQISNDAEWAYSFVATYSQVMADGDATGNYTIHGFEKDNDSEKGLLDLYLYIRKGTNNNNTLFKGNSSDSSVTIETVANAGAETSGGFSLSPEYIWKIDIADNEPESFGNNSQKLCVQGTLRSVGTDLYLQAYDGSSTNLKLGAANKGNVYFRINFNGQDELGTIFCYYDDNDSKTGNYYYIGTDNEGNTKWIQTSSLDALDTDNGYQILTFETLDAEEIDDKKATIQNHIYFGNESESSDSEIRRKIYRNDFFLGNIPIDLYKYTIKEIYITSAKYQSQGGNSEVVITSGTFTAHGSTIDYNGSTTKYSVDWSMVDTSGTITFYYTRTSDGESRTYSATAEISDLIDSSKGAELVFKGQGGEKP